MDKKYVIYIGEMIMPDKNACAQRISSICNSLIDIGYIPIVLGLDPDIEDNIDIIETKKVHLGFDCYAVKYPNRKKEWIRRCLTIKPIKKIINLYGKERIDSIIAIDYEVIPLVKLSLYCKHCGIKLIVDTVEWYGQSQLAFPMNVIKDFDTNFRMKFVYPHSRNMICISRYLYEYYEDIVQNITCIPGTVDLSLDKWKQIPTYQPNRIFTLGYAGSPGLKMDKERVDWLIHAVCEIYEEGEKINLIMAGFDKETFESSHQELVNLNCYKKVVNIVGKLSHSECLKLISKSDFSVIVREDKRVTRAGFPTKLSESLGCGTPVITTPSSNVDEYIKDEINGFITNEFSIDALKYTIRRAMSISHNELIELHKNTKNENPLTYDKFTEKLKVIMNAEGYKYEIE